MKKTTKAGYNCSGTSKTHPIENKTPNISMNKSKPTSTEIKDNKFFPSHK